MRRIIYSFVILSVVLQTGAPIFAQAATRGALPPARAKTTQASPPVLRVLPPFPEDKNAFATDWSKIAWDKEIVFPEEQDVYRRAVNAVKNAEEAKKITPPAPHRMTDDAFLEHYNAPQAVRETVRALRDELRKTVPQGARDKVLARIQGTLRLQGFGLSAEEERARAMKVEDEEFARTHRVDVRTAPRLLSPRLHAVSPPPAPSIERVGSQSASASHRLSDVTIEGLRARAQKASTSSGAVTPPASGTGVSAPAPRKGALLRIMQWIVQKAHSLVSIPAARAENLTPLIAYYDGIEQNPSDRALYWLSQQQNPDGSFGENNQYETTAQVVWMATTFGLTSSGQYTAALNYLTITVPQNNREKALKSRVLTGLGQSAPAQALLDEIKATKNADDGGYGLDARYTSDVDTTMQVALAYYAANTEIQGALPQALFYVATHIADDGAIYYTKDSAASFYLINNTARSLAPFQGFTVGSADGTLQITIQSKITALLNYLKMHTNSTGGTLIGSADTIDTAMTATTFGIYAELPDGRRALQTHVRESAEGSGGFGASLQTTVEALRALAAPDLTITAVKATTALVEKTPATFELTITNRGYAPSVAATLYQFADNLNLDTPWDFSANNIVLAPQQTMSLILTFPDTTRFIGDTEMKWYVEGAGESSYKNNWLAQTFMFAAPADATPALPLYYIAQQYENGGSAGINVRWQKKADSNRLNYVVMLREKGTASWGYYPIDDSWNGAFLTGFTEGKVYEVTAGVMHKDGNTVTYFTATTDVRVSADPKKYMSGLQGTVVKDGENLPSVSLYGYSANGKSDSTGAFAFSNIPNGSTALRVYEYQYEELYTKVSSPIGATSTAKVFTRLKPDTTPPTITSFEIRYKSNYIVKNQIDAELLVFGNDNVYLERSEFFLFDPNKDAWEFLGGQPTNGSESLFPWFVPANLLGKGYKVKAIIYDYQGNSATQEWGPFEIIDGTSPTGTVTVQGLTNNEWSLGEQKTINWSIKTASPLKTIDSIRLKYGNNQSVVQGNYDITKTSYEYTMPLYSNNVSAAVTVILSVCDTNNNCALVESDPFAVVDKTPLPHAPWGAPQQFPGITSAYGNERYIDSLFMNQDGSLEILYREFAGYTYDQAGQFKRLVYRKLSGGVWSAPLTVKEYWYSSATGGDDVSINDVRAVKAQNGDLHIVFQSTPGGGIAGLDKDEIQYAHIANDALVSSMQLSNDTTDSSEARLAVATDGTVSVVWAEGYVFSTQTGFKALKYREGDGYANWKNTETLTDDWTSRQTIIVENGNRVISYWYKNQFWARKKTGSSWSAGVPVMKREIPKADLDVYVEDAGKFVSIVAANPNDATLYNWLPQIKSKADLEQILIAQQFVKKAEILEAWRLNEYTNGSYDTMLFARGGNTYDLFYRQGTQKTGYKYDVKALRFSTDFSAVSSVIISALSVTGITGKESINSFRTAQSADGNYQVFYVKQETTDDGSIWNRAYHALFTGTGTYFKARTSALTMGVDDNTIGGAELGGKVMILFRGYIGGNSVPMYNSADYNTISSYRLDTVSPLDLASTPPKDGMLSWKIIGGSADSFDVLLGSDSNILAPIVTGITASSIKLPPVSGNTTYFWQVVAHLQGVSVYSNPWSFTVPPLTVNTSFTPATGIAPLSVQFDASAGNGPAPSLPTSTNFTGKTFSTSIPVIDQGGTLTQADGGTTLFLQGYTAKKTPLAYTLTKDTVLEFDFKGTAGQPLMSAIGLEVPGNTQGNRAIQVWGTATPGWTILNYYNYLPAQWKHYKIPIGTHYTGLTDSIFFINRGPATTNSAFKNIRIYENTQDAFTYAWDVDNDGTTDATTKNFFYTYSSAGTYTATLKVSDGMSTVTKQMTVTVQ